MNELRGRRRARALRRPRLSSTGAAAPRRAAPAPSSASPWAARCAGWSSSRSSCGRSTRKAFALSRPILSLDVHPLPAPQRPDDPFCFGGLRVAPRGDRAFRTSDEPWLFVVVRAPGGRRGRPPQLAAELLSQGRRRAKRKYPIPLPPPRRCDGFAGQWGLGIPLPVAGPAGRLPGLAGGDREGRRSSATATPTSSRSPPRPPG